MCAGWSAEGGVEPGLVLPDGAGGARPQPDGRGLAQGQGVQARPGDGGHDRPGGHTLTGAISITPTISIISTISTISILFPGARRVPPAGHPWHGAGGRGEHGRHLGAGPH